MTEEVRDNNHTLSNASSILPEVEAVPSPPSRSPSPPPSAPVVAADELAIDADLTAVADPETRDAALSIIPPPPPLPTNNHSEENKQSLPPPSTVSGRAAAMSADSFGAPPSPKSQRRKTSISRSLLGNAPADSSDVVIAPSSSSSISARSQPILAELMREEEAHQRERMTASASGRRTTPFINTGGSATMQRPNASPGSHEYSYDQDTYVPPGANALQNQTREMRSTSFSNYNFSHYGDERRIRTDSLDVFAAQQGGHQRAAPLSPQPELDDIEHGVVEEVHGDLNGMQDSVSATDLERHRLEHSEAAHESKQPGPLLSEYKSSTSSIRKDWTTVDWFFSKSLMHRMRRLMRQANRNSGWKGKFLNIFLAGQGWFVLFAVGACTAFSASIIHSVSAWLSDMKGGYCSGHNLFVTRRVCCMDEQTPDAVCEAWSKWNEGVAHEGSGGANFWNAIIYILFATVFATLGSWVCVVFARQAAGSGIAELKIVLGGFIIKKFLGIRTLLFKTMGLTLAVASGMSLGKEGPMVHIACAWGNILARPFLKYSSNEVKRREVLSASVAAGVTAAFGSPLGGVLFSLEVVSSYFPPKTMWRSFWCAICTALVLEAIDPFQTGKLVQFAVTITRWQWFEIFPMIFLGALGGCMGALFIKLNVLSTKFRKGNRWLRANPVGEVAILAICTACISVPNLFMRGNSGSLLAQLFSNCWSNDVAADDDRNQGADSVVSGLCDHDGHPWGQLGLVFLAAILKFFLTTVTYGSSIPSGVFMPSLCIGALLGRIMGQMMLEWHRSVGDVFIFSICAGKTNCINPALYAVIGAASVLGGITRMTVSLAVIMFEVTGGLDIIVPIMVAVVCSKWFGDAFSKASLYGQLIELNGLPHIDPHEELDLIDPAADCMSTDPVCLTTYGNSLAHIKEILENEVFHGFPIIDNPHDRLVTGFIARSDLEMEIDKIEKDKLPCGDEMIRIHFSREPPPFPAPHFLDFSNVVDKYPILVRPSMPVDRIMTLFQSLGLRYTLCVTPRGRIMGIIKKKDMLLYLHAHNIHLR